MATFRVQYKVGEELGRGAFAVVHKCQRRTNAKDYAVKIIDKSKANDAQLSDIKSEVDLLREIKHDRVVNVEDVVSTMNAMYIVMELVKGGDVFKMISKLRNYDEGVCAELIGNLCQALEYLHDRGIAHRDLKPDNMLLLREMPKGRVDLISRKASSRERAYSADDMRSALSDIKVADFGFATRSGTGKEGESMTKCCGTPYYIAPEILHVGLYKTKKAYGKQCDMWSVGVIAYVLLCGFPPFQAQRRNDLFKKVIRGNFSFPAGTVWDHISDDAKDFIKKLLVVDPEKRATPFTALQHPWIQNNMPGGDQARMGQTNAAEPPATTTPAPPPQRITRPLPEVQKRLENFNARLKFRAAVFGVEATFRLLYIQKCENQAIKPNSGVVAELEEREGEVEGDSIDLSQNYVGEKAMGPLMELIKEKKRLKKLILHNNEVENTDVDTIVKTLERHPSITHIDLSSNPLSRTAAKKIIKLLCINPNIQRVDLQNTKLHPHKLESIEKLLKRNKEAFAKAKQSVPKGEGEQKKTETGSLPAI